MSRRAELPPCPLNPGWEILKRPVCPSVIFFVKKVMVLLASEPVAGDLGRPSCLVNLISICDFTHIYCFLYINFRNSTKYLFGEYKYGNIVIAVGYVYLLPFFQNEGANSEKINRHS